MSFQLLSLSSFFYLLCFLFVIVVEIQLSLSKPCLLPFICGNVRARYPFWGGDRPEFCGHPALKLYCEEDGITATMMMEGVKYRVLNLDYTNEVLKIARHDMRGICPPDHLKTTIDSALFNYSSNEYENLTLSFSCSLAHGLENCDDVIYKDGFIRGRDVPSLPCKGNNSVDVLVPKNLLGEAKQNLLTLEQVLKQGFELRWTVDPTCVNCRKSINLCGYNSSKLPVCYCSYVPTSNSTRCILPPVIPSETSASVLGMVIILSVLIVAGLRQRLTADKIDQNIEAFVRNYGSIAPKRYIYSDVKKITKSFSNKLGQGGYGDVYKGKLPDGLLVAVKVLKASKGNGEEFINEVASISRTSHVNIVAFLGFSFERKKRALIYEFMPNGSLDKYIYDQESSSMKRKLEWKTMYQITVGIARGLEYLHRGCNVRIVHFDIKPHNILLDQDFCPKISDFGLSKQSKNKKSIISMLDARGTAGYIAPEVFCRSFGGVSHKSDVYSYGMMILEMVGGRKNTNVKMSHTSDIYFPDSIYKRLEPGKDFELHGVVTEEEKAIAKKMILVSLWCIQTIPSDRPSMTQVVDMLEGSLENIEIPPKPCLSSPTRSPKFSSHTSSYHHFLLPEKNPA